MNALQDANLSAQKEFFIRAYLDQLHNPTESFSSGLARYERSALNVSNNAALNRSKRPLPMVEDVLHDDCSRFQKDNITAERPAKRCRGTIDARLGSTGTSRSSLATSPLGFTTSDQEAPPVFMQNFACEGTSRSSLATSPLGFTTSDQEAPPVFVQNFACDEPSLAIHPDAIQLLRPSVLASATTDRRSQALVAEQGPTREERAADANDVHPSSSHSHHSSSVTLVEHNSSESDILSVRNFLEQLDMLAAKPLSAEEKNLLILKGFKVDNDHLSDNGG